MKKTMMVKSIDMCLYQNSLKEIDFVIIGNPENRRITYFQQALKALQLKPAKVVAYYDLLCKNTKILDRPINQQPI